MWDYNLTYGHDEFGNRSRYDVWQFNNSDNNGPKFWKDLYDTGMFRCYMARRFAELTQPGQPLNYDVVCARMDEFDEWIAEGVGRDNQRWQKMQNHASEVRAMKTWINQRINWMSQNLGIYAGCADVDLPPLVISKIHYHPEDWWAVDGDRLEFIEITNNGDEPVDLTGIYFRELGITYNFPVGATLAAHAPLLLCSDSLTFIDYYGLIPFGQFYRNLSNKSENLVLADAWGNIIDEVHYYDSDPWPEEADGDGPFLQLIDLNLDNSLPESWTLGIDITLVAEHATSMGFKVFPNPVKDVLNVSMCSSLSSVATEYRISNMLGQTLMSGRFALGHDTVGHHAAIDVSSLSPGLYFITIGELTQKFIK